MLTLMRHAPAVLVLLFVSGVAHAGNFGVVDIDKDNQKERSQDSLAVREGARPHDGVWKAIAAVLGGVRLPNDAAKAITLKIADGNYEVTVEGEMEPDKGTYTLDATTKPHRMTIKSTAGPNRGKTFLAIFEMKDDVSMRVCYDLSGTDFPMEFKAPRGTQLFLVGYRRQNDEPAAKAPPM